VSEITGIDIPVIDIGDFLAGRNADDAARQVEAAATTLGFLQIVGHGVPAEAIDGVYDAMGRLSSLPPEAKQAYLSEGHPYRGFHMNRDQAGKVRQERFLVSRFDDIDSAVAGGVPADLADFFFSNIWPEIDGFRAAVTELFGHTNALAGRMMSLFALALGLEADYFATMLEPNASTFAINHYPARGEALGPEGPPVLFAEHADGNTLTILHQRGSYEGLQIRPLGGAGEWTYIPVVDDAFVINVGELMTHWTNDHWPSTRHRVLASSDPEASRTTLTTFHMPALDAVVAPLAVCGGREDPHYDAVTPYEWERAFMARNYQRRALEVDPKVRDFLEALPS
jgi:isopenicillin N synthase-like dioxygenase